jgi:hypothetical protein
MWPGREADHSTPSIAKVKAAWNYTSIPQDYVVWCLIKHKDSFTLTLSAKFYNFQWQQTQRFKQPIKTFRQESVPSTANQCCKSNGNK